MAAWDSTRGLRTIGDQLESPGLNDTEAKHAGNDMREDRENYYESILLESGLILTKPFQSHERDFLRA